MSITTQQFVSDFVDQLVAQGVALSSAAGLKTTLKGKFDLWLDAPDAVPANLAQRLATAVGQFQAEVLERYDFWSGTVGGGPNSDGTFPLALPDGTVVQVPCLAKLTQALQKGDPGGIGFRYSTTTTDADPGAGYVRFNNATYSAATTLFVDDLEVGGASVAAWLNTFDDGTATGVTGALLLQEVGTVHFALFQVTGAVVDGGGYRKIPVAHLASAGPIANNGRIVASFSPPGAQGEKGWSPQFALADDGNRRVLQVTGWAGGQGTAPATGQYVGAAGLVSDITTAIDVRGVQGPKLFEAVYASQAALFADLAYVAGSFGLVYNDATQANNGTYVKAGGAGAGSWAQNGSVPGLSFQTLASETGYVAAFVDAVGRPAWLIAVDGTFIPSKISLPSGSVLQASIAAGSVSLAKLDAALQGAIALAPQSQVASETGVVWSLQDAKGRYAVAVAPDGTVNIPKLTLGPNVVAPENLTPPLTALIAKTLNADSGFLWGVVDSAGRYPLAVQADGSVVIPKLRSSSIFGATLADENANFVLWAYQDGAGRWQLRTQRKSDGQVFSLALTSGNNLDGRLTSDDHVLFYSDSAGAYYHVAATGGSYWTLLPSSDFAAAGDSMTAAGSGFTDYFSPLYPTRTTYNQGVGGQRTASIAARFGAKAMTCQVTGGQIPTSGSVTITNLNDDFLGSTGALAVRIVIKGILCNLTRDPPSGFNTLTPINYPVSPVAASGTVSFTVDSVTVPGASAVGAASISALWNSNVIIRVGINDIGKVDYSQAGVIADIQAMVGTLTVRGKRVIVAGVTNGYIDLPTTMGGSRSSEAESDLYLGQIAALNTALAAAFPGFYADPLANMIALGGGAPATVNGHTYTVLTSTFLGDGRHENTAGKTATANYFKSIIDAKGW